MEMANPFLESFWKPPKAGLQSPRDLPSPQPASITQYGVLREKFDVITHECLDVWHHSSHHYPLFLVINYHSMNSLYRYDGNKHYRIVLKVRMLYSIDIDQVQNQSLCLCYESLFKKVTQCDWLKNRFNEHKTRLSEQQCGRTYACVKIIFWVFIFTADYHILISKSV